jgi:four helix bundle protein
MKQNTPPTSNGFDALDLAYELIRSVKSVLAEIERRDRSLADQGRRAVQSIALNLAEGRGRVGKDRIQLWRYAFGSAEELEAVLKTADAFGYVGDLASVFAMLDREHAMLWRLTRR